MSRMLSSLLVAALAGAHSLATGAAESLGGASRSGAPPGDTRSALEPRENSAYPLRRGTEVTMLWYALTKMPLPREKLACEYLVERNFERDFERDRPLMMDADYSCASMDEFTRRDRIAAVAPQIEAEFAALSMVKEFRFWLRLPIREYDFRRGGYATGLSNRASVPFPFQYSLEDGALLLENAGRLAFLPVDEARARELDGPLWLFELTIRPTGFAERPFSKASTAKIIKAKILRARVFTTENYDMLSVRSPARAQSDSPVFEAMFDSGASPRHRTR